MYRLLSVIILVLFLICPVYAADKSSRFKANKKLINKTVRRLKLKGTSRWYFRGSEIEKVGTCVGASLNPGTMYEDNQLFLKVKGNQILLVDSLFNQLAAEYSSIVLASKKRKFKRTLRILGGDLEGRASVVPGQPFLDQSFVGLNDLKKKRGKKNQPYFTGVRDGSAIFSLTEYLLGEIDCSRIFEIEALELYDPNNVVHNPNP